MLSKDAYPYQISWLTQLKIEKWSSMYALLECKLKLRFSNSYQQIRYSNGIQPCINNGVLLGIPLWNEHIGLHIMCKNKHIHNFKLFTN